jgi:hypothetical protein
MAAGNPQITQGSISIWEQDFRMLDLKHLPVLRMAGLVTYNEI